MDSDGMYILNKISHIIFFILEKYSDDDNTMPSMDDDNKRYVRCYVCEYGSIYIGIK